MLAMFYYYIGSPVIYLVPFVTFVTVYYCPKSVSMYLVSYVIFAMSAMMYSVSSFIISSIFSSTDSRVNLPYYEPEPKPLEDFLARASKKRQEYAALIRPKDIQYVQQWFSMLLVI